MNYKTPIHFAELRRDVSTELGRKVDRDIAEGIAAQLGVPLSPKYGIRTESPQEHPQGQFLRREARRQRVKPDFWSDPEEPVVVDPELEELSD